MNKKEIIRLYIDDLFVHFEQSQARDNRISQLRQELERSDNSDYATALKVWDEFGEKGNDMLASQFGFWVTQRLNQNR